jgi:hypothetical protein
MFTPELAENIVKVVDEFPGIARTNPALALALAQYDTDVTDGTLPLHRDHVILPDTGQTWLRHTAKHVHWL